MLDTRCVFDDDDYDDVQHRIDGVIDIKTVLNVVLTT